MTLRGKVALIVGVSTPIGRSIAELFFEKGCSLVVTDDNGEVAEQAANQLNERPVYQNRAYATRLDVGDERNWRTTVKLCVDTLRTIDILVTQARIHQSYTVEAVTLNSWNNIFTASATVQFLGARAVLPVMRAKKTGSIINVVTRASTPGMPIPAASCCALGAVQQFSKALAVEVGQYNVRVNTVSAETSERSPAQSFKMDDNSKLPALGRVAQPREVAQSVLFFASNSATFVTGGTLCADGGVSAQRMMTA